MDYEPSVPVIGAVWYRYIKFEDIQSPEPM